MTWFGILGIILMSLFLAWASVKLDKHFFSEDKQKPSGYSHDCPFCGYHIVVCVSPTYLKCIYCTRRWKLEEDL